MILGRITVGAAFQHLRSKHAEEELSPGGGKKEDGEEEEQSLTLCSWREGEGEEGKRAAMRGH